MIAAWFVSDIHLKDINERSGNILLRFLHSLTERERPVTHLFLLGDIFDLWIGESAIFAERFGPIVEALAKLRRQGVEIHYFEGNHDVHVSKFWEKNLGIPCWTEAKYFSLGKKLLRLEHGDLINLNDQAYLRYRRFYRHGVMEKLAYGLPGLFWDGLGKWASRTSRKYSAKDRESRNQELREMIRAHAHRSFAEAPFDAVISGHMHIRDDYEFAVDGRLIRSLNLGSWFDSPHALSLINDEFHWVSLA